MRITLLNSKFEYRLEDKLKVVNISETSLKNLVVSCLKDGSDGVSGVKCLVTGESLFLCCTEKLRKQYQLEYENSEGYTEKEIELEDNFVDFERCDACNEGFAFSEMGYDAVSEVYLCRNCHPEV